MRHLEHDTIRIVIRGRSAMIAFNSSEIGDDVDCLADHREELLSLILSGQYNSVSFDVTGMKTVPRGLLGLLSSTNEQGCDVELVNPSEELQEVVRAAKLDAWLLIRGSTPDRNG